MSQRHRILILGTGSIGERHLRYFLATGRTELAFCEPVDRRREEVVGRYSAARAFASVADALAAASFDAAVIATPAPSHIPLALELAAHGLHLLIEKPLSLSLDRVEELARLVANRQLKASVGYMWRTNPALQAMKCALDSGRFGAPVQIVITTGQAFAFYRPAYRDIYYAKHEQGGGAIQDALTHHLNAAEWLVGPITRVAADADHCVLPGVEVEDTVHVITRHGPVMGSVSLNQHQPPNEYFITVACQRGAVRYNLTKQAWFSAEEPGGNWKLEAAFTLDRDGYYIRQAEAFLDYLEDKAPAPCPLSAGIQTLRANLAVQAAVRSRRWEDVA